MSLKVTKDLTTRSGFIKQLKNGDLLAEVFNAMPDTFIFVKDKKGRFMLVNDLLLLNMGLENEKQVIGKTDFDFWPKALAKKYAEDDMKVIHSSQSIINREEIILGRNKEEIWHSTTKTPLYNKKGDVIGLAGITRDVSMQKKLLLKVKDQKKKLEHLNITDSLTGVYNRRFLTAQMPSLLKVHQRNNKIFSICLFDLDSFKHINDTYGHAAGDYVLKRFCKVIPKFLQRTTDYFVRYGGDEFVAIMLGTNAKEAEEMCTKILEHFNSIKWPKTYFNTSFKSTISVGIASAAKETTINAILKKADKALYMTKNQGKNKISLY